MHALARSEALDARVTEEEANTVAEAAAAEAKMGKHPAPMHA